MNVNPQVQEQHQHLGAGGQELGEDRDICEESWMRDLLAMRLLRER